MRIFPERRPSFAFLFSLIAAIFISISAQAQMPSIKVLNEDKKDTKAGVKLNALHIDVQVIGNIATTVMTMSFTNNTNKVLEGELTFPMPDGVSISRYALDINGKMREAVPVEKARATEVFESIEHRQVDPGLLEKVEGNNFRTRIYPFPAGGTRKVIIGYEQELRISDQQMLRFQLPLNYQQNIPEFSLKATIMESSQKPILVEQPDGSFSFDGNGKAYIASMKRSNFAPKHGLVINLPKANVTSETFMQPAESSHYFLTNVFINEPSRAHEWSNHIGLIWDVSLRGLQRNTEKELAVLDKFFKERKNLTIELGLLNNTFKKGGTFAITNGNWTQLREKLTSLIYDGGTDYSKISESMIKANEYLFFTDGFSGFGTQRVSLKQPVYTVNSAARADYSNLKYISGKSGGKFIDLSQLSVEEAARQLFREDLQFLGVKNNPFISELYPSIPVSVSGSISIAGISSKSATEIVLLFGYGNKVLMERKVSLNAAAHTSAGVQISKIWAQKKLSEMDVHYDEHKEEIGDLAKQFGLVTRNTSLLVLESVDDYIRYGIEPPAELQKEFQQVRKEQRLALQEERKNIMGGAFKMTKELKAWWNTDFPAKKRFPNPDNQVLFRGRPPIAPNADGIVFSSGEERNELSRNTREALSEAVVYGYMAKSKVTRSSLNPVSPEIIIPKFRNDQDYMKNLNGSPAQVYQQYLKLRETYGTTPTFYINMSDWFYEHTDPQTGLMILSNLTALDLENPELYKMLIYKLKQIGDFDAELFVSKKVLEWRPMEAQSYRDYALALADCGNYQFAIDQLYAVLTQSYSNDIANRNSGIEEVIIAEINNLISLHKDHLNIKKMDKDLIYALPVDVRIVMNWNKKDTDIDLWVTDPNGEKCYYEHRETAAGGRISRDFTTGYGPEQFMIKKAIKGEYRIQVDYYGDTQITISGPTTVMAEIYTNYGRKNQQRKLVTLQLSGKEGKGVLIGTFSF